MIEGQGFFDKEWNSATFSKDRASLYSERKGVVSEVLPMYAPPYNTDKWFYRVPFSKVLLLTDKIRFFPDGRFTNEDKTVKLTKEYLDVLGFKA
jgi:hypothetical protein